MNKEFLPLSLARACALLMTYVITFIVDPTIDDENHSIVIHLINKSQAFSSFNQGFSKETNTPRIVYRTDSLRDKIEITDQSISACDVFVFAYPSNQMHVVTDLINVGI